MGTRGPATSASSKPRSPARRSPRPARRSPPSYIDFLHAPPALRAGERRDAGTTRWPRSAEVERAHIHRVLDAVSWNKKRAAEVLDIGRETLYRKIAEFNLTPSA